jgi:high-affinity nickel-transport protein
LLSAALLGFALGIRHAADSDHLAAIAALVARHRSPAAAARIGAIWGIGHSFTIFAVGGAMIALRIHAAPAWARAAEAIVAVVMVGLGISNLRSFRAGASQGHAHGRPRAGRGVALRAFAVGLSHGLAGSAAIALLALAAMPTPETALLYLAIFGLGTVGGMVALSTGVGLPVSVAGSRPALARWVMAGSGVLSIGVGIYVAVSVGVAADLL